MGNFEKLSVLVIVVIIVMILVVALYPWTENPESPASGGTEVTKTEEPAPIGGGPNAIVIPPIAQLPPSGPKPLVAAPGMGEPGAKPPESPARTLAELIEGAKRNDMQPAIESTPAPVVETPKPAEPKIHVVEPGQTMGAIAKVYYPGQVQKGLQAMQAANPTVESSRMRVGTKLTIPDLGAPAAGSTTTASAPAPAAAKPTASIERGGWYVTKRGDTLTSISKRAYGTSERWPEIWIENMEALGTDFERPDPGIRIRIPR